MNAKTDAEAKRQTTKLARFERLAERRMTETLKRLRLIGNLANKRNYTYSQKHVEQILETLESELRQLKGKFRQEGGASAQVFVFKK